MDHEQAERIVDGMSMHGVDADLREDYSGRGMYGETTPGIIVPEVNDLMAIGFAAAEEEIAYRDLPRHIDSMGLGFIAY